MSKQNNPSSITAVKPAGEISNSTARTVPQDLWGNIIYFLIVTSAICFVLVNNTLSRLMTTTGIVVLSILFILDLFAIVPLFRLLLMFIVSRSKGKNR